MSSELGLLVQVGYDGAATKYYVIATGTVLFYDYLLTLADEIKYAWNGKKSWAFWLFLVNRYVPMSYLFWLLSTTYTPHYNAEICQRSAWYPIFMFIVCTFLAQVVLTLRIYAVTMKNTRVGIGFVVITASQFALGVYILVRSIREGAQPLPPIPLDAYRLCVFVTHEALEIAYTTISLFYDSLAFLVIIYLAMRTKMLGLTIPMVLETIAKDAMWYFFVIFSSHFVFQMTVILGRDSIKLLPGP